MRYLLFPLAFFGCPTTPDESGETDKVGTDPEETGDTEDTNPDDTGDTGEPVDTSETGGTAETGDTAETGETGSVEPLLTGVSWDFTEQTINTRDNLLVVVTATFDDGSHQDVTAVSAWATSDEAVAKVYEAGTVQTIGAGNVTVSATYGGTELSGLLTVEVIAAAPGDLVFNEVLADGTVDGDPNDDGNADSIEDEYLEIANYGDVTVDLSGCTIIEDDFYTGLPRHTFAEGTILRAGEAIVVFGGGDASSLAAENVQFVVATNSDSGLQYGLSLNNEGEYVALHDPAGNVLASMAYGDGTDVEAIEDASMVLSPDVWGTEYTHHAYATGSTSDYSVGTYVDGTAFPGVDGRYAP